MLEQAILMSTAAEIDSLDLSEENDRIAELETELERIARAQEKGRARIAEIRTLKRESTQTQEGAGVAAMLLKDAPPTDAAMTVRTADALHEEQDNLSSGIRELRARAAICQNEISETRRSAERKLQQAVQPLRDSLMDEARLAAEKIVEVFAAVKTLYLATGAASRDLYAVEMALDGVMMRDHALLPRRLDLEAPEALRHALAGLAEKGSAVQRRAPIAVAAFVPPAETTPGFYG